MPRSLNDRGSIHSAAWVSVDATFEVTLAEIINFRKCQSRLNNRVPGGSKSRKGYGLFGRGCEFQYRRWTKNRIPMKTQVCGPRYQSACCSFCRDTELLCRKGN